uniref:RagB/SusD family nutrient uptake outer membrane protein n=1 Tax=Pedobacter schmidteae TaxID=2201271 RepID=UPI000EB49E8D|nr:RagB/SusD family nutrient uptake outer membrane protein [Pedobacter schmidteae]
MKAYIKTLKKTAIIAGAILALNGCKIDTDPLDRYTDVAVYQNPANIRLYIIGMYNEFQTFKFGTFPIGYDNATDALTDLMKYSSGISGNGTVNILASDASRVSAAGPQLNYWTAGYGRIRRLNEFLEGLDTKAQGLDETTKLKFQAEARFIRGYVYFWLVKMHGSVVLLDKLTSDKDNPRASEDACWNFVAADFAFAAEYLPKTWDSSNTGRATKGAAFGMLARTWLYAASIAEYDKKQFNVDELTGVPVAKATEYYTNASKAADEVKKLAAEGLYDLDANFASVFTNKNTKEAIFKIDYIRPQITHQYDLGFAPPKDAPGQVLVYGVPTAELVDEFEMNDGSTFSWSNPAMAANPYANREQRFNATILFNGASWKGRTINTTTSDVVEGITEYGASSDPKRTVSGYYARKFLDPLNTSIVINKSDQSWMELRYAEVLLIDAEAKSKINDIPGAKNSLNTLRNKRGLPNTPSQTPAEMMKAVEHERIIELAFEGHRYWDLRRWRKAHMVLNNVRFTGHKGSPSGSGVVYTTISVDNTNRQFTPALYYIPIPQDEILRNNAIKQIKGW